MNPKICLISPESLHLHIFTSIKPIDQRLLVSLEGFRLLHIKVIKILEDLFKPVPHQHVWKCGLTERDFRRPDPLCFLSGFCCTETCREFPLLFRKAVLSLGRNPIRGLLPELVNPDHTAGILKFLFKAAHCFPIRRALHLKKPLI